MKELMESISIPINASLSSALAVEKSDLNAFMERDCPFCSSERSFVAVASEPIGDLLPLSQLKKSWFGSFKKKVFFRYFRCSDCGLLYNKKFFNEKTLESLYSSNPDNTAGLDINLLRFTQRGYANFLRQHATIGGQYLELGPDRGLLAEEVKKCGNIDHFWFFEPNQEVHESLRTAMCGSSITISAEMNDFSSVPDDSLDIATLIHVLDHLIEPSAILKKIHRKLKVGAKILIVTHDESSLLATWLGRRWPAFCLQHPLLFNVKTTKRFLEHNGFKGVKTAKSSNYFPISHLLQHLAFALGFTRLKLPKIQRPALSLRLGNIITVAERH